jgi:hypothetical protein
MEGLAKRGYLSYAPNKFGHGDSPTPFGGYHRDSLVSGISASVLNKVDLVIGGQGSDWMLPGDLDVVRAGIGPENLRNIKGVGHGIHRNDQQKFMLVIDAFTEEVGI